VLDGSIRLILDPSLSLCRCDVFEQLWEVLGICPAQQYLCPKQS
jgi:hypothetical protein